MFGVSRQGCTDLKTSIPASPNLSELIAKNGMMMKIRAGIDLTTADDAPFRQASQVAKIA
jgi:hypothetical protein